MENIMPANVRYYMVVAQLRIPDIGTEFRSALISEPQELKAREFPLRLALERFLFNYKGARYSLFRGSEKEAKDRAISQVVKQAARIDGADKISPDLIEIVIDLRKTMVRSASTGEPKMDEPELVFEE